MQNWILSLTSKQTTSKVYINIRYNGIYFLKMEPMTERKPTGQAKILNRNQMTKRHHNKYGITSQIKILDSKTEHMQIRFHTACINLQSIQSHKQIAQ